MRGTQGNTVQYTQNVAIFRENVWCLWLHVVLWLYVVFVVYMLGAITVVHNVWPCAIYLRNEKNDSGRQSIALFPAIDWIGSHVIGAFVN